MPTQAEVRQESRDVLQRIPDIPQGIDAFTVVGPAIEAWARNVGAAIVTRAPA